MHCKNEKKLPLIAMYPHSSTVLAILINKTLKLAIVFHKKITAGGVIWQTHSSCKKWSWLDFGSNLMKIKQFMTIFIPCSNLRAKIHTPFISLSIAFSAIKLFLHLWNLIWLHKYVLLNRYIDLVCPAWQVCQTQTLRSSILRERANRTGYWPTVEYWVAPGHNWIMTRLFTRPK